jgi:hypothetical protein
VSRSGCDATSRFSAPLEREPLRFRDLDNPCSLFAPGKPSHGGACEGDGHYLCNECDQLKWPCIDYAPGPVSLDGDCYGSNQSLAPCETCSRRVWDPKGTNRFARIVVGVAGV